MIQRVAATIVATLILWFVWWFFGVMLVFWLDTVSGPLGVVVGAVWWLGVVAIPAFVWFSFRHVSNNQAIR